MKDSMPFNETIKIFKEKLKDIPSGAMTQDHIKTALIVYCNYSKEEAKDFASKLGVRGIRELIKELGKSHTVILSSHILSEVRQICNKVIIINKGKIIITGTPKDIKNETNTTNLRDAFFKIVGDNNE